MRNLKLFVYGTLREGCGNHRLLGLNAVKVCNGTIRAQLWMDGGLPMITKTDGMARVVGEVWQLEDTNRLADVDMLEGHPHWYRREEVEVISYENANEKPVKESSLKEGDACFEVSQVAWAYFMRSGEVEGARPVLNGDFCAPQFADEEE